MLSFMGHAFIESILDARDSVREPKRERTKNTPACHPENPWSSREGKSRQKNDISEEGSK